MRDGRYERRAVERLWSAHGGDGFATSTRVQSFFDYGNVRTQAQRGGFARAFAFPGFVPDINRAFSGPP
ncbi:MAG: hypothetical protein WBW76_02855 [Candidatus Cybelea sp.]